MPVPKFHVGSPREERPGWMESVLGQTFSLWFLITVSWVFLYIRHEVRIPVSCPYLSHCSIGHKAHYWMALQQEPSLHVINSVLGQFKLKPVKISYFKSCLFKLSSTSTRKDAKTVSIYNNSGHYRSVIQSYLFDGSHATQSMKSDGKFKFCYEIGLSGDQNNIMKYKNYSFCACLPKNHLTQGFQYFY